MIVGYHVRVNRSEHRSIFYLHDYPTTSIAEHVVLELRGQVGTDTTFVVAAAHAAARFVL